MGTLDFERLEAEIKEFGEGPSADLPVGSPERLQWFANWLRTLESRTGYDCEEDALRQHVASSQAQRIPDDTPFDERMVDIVPVDRLRDAFRTHRKLKWDEHMCSYAEQSGALVEENAADGTVRVMFSDNRFAWLPISAVTTQSECSVERRVRIAP